MFGILDLLSPNRGIARARPIAVRKRVPMSAETKAKISKAMTGRKLSKEHIESFRMANKGIKKSEEHKANQRRIALEKGLLRKISINGKIYRCPKEASEELGIPISTVRYRCNSKKNKSYMFL